MTRIDPVMFEGREIIPLQFLKALPLDPFRQEIGNWGLPWIEV